MKPFINGEASKTRSIEWFEGFGYIHPFVLTKPLESRFCLPDGAIVKD